MKRAEKTDGQERRETKGGWDDGWDWDLVHPDSKPVKKRETKGGWDDGWDWDLVHPDSKPVKKRETK